MEQHTLTHHMHPLPPSTVRSCLSYKLAPEYSTQKEKAIHAGRSEAEKEEKGRKLRNLRPHERNDLMKANKNTVLKPAMFPFTLGRHTIRTRLSKSKFCLFFNFFFFAELIARIY